MDEVVVGREKKEHLNLEKYITLAQQNKTEMEDLKIRKKMTMELRMRQLILNKVK